MGVGFMGLASEINAASQTRTHVRAHTQDRELKVDVLH